MDTNEQALVQVAAAPLAAPSAAVAGLVAASIAPNTKRTYAAALKRLDAALEGQDLTDASLSIYLASLHAAGLSPAVASMAVASVKFRCRLQALASPVGPATDRVLAGLRREGKGRGRGQVDGVRFSQVDAAAAVAANDDGSVAGLRDAALLAVASDGLLRVSEVAALDVGDVQAEADGSAGHQDGPLFRRVRRGGRVEGDPGRRLSVNAIRRIIRSRAAAVGIESRVSGHSLRVGGAQSLAAGGASIVEMANGGGAVGESADVDRAGSVLRHGLDHWLGGGTPSQTDRGRVDPAWLPGPAASLRDRDAHFAGVMPLDD